MGGERIQIGEGEGAEMPVTLDDKCVECGAVCFLAEWTDLLRHSRECKVEHKHNPSHDVCCSLSTEIPEAFVWHHSRVFACFSFYDDTYEKKPNKYIIKRYKRWLTMQMSLIRRAERDLK